MEQSRDNDQLKNNHVIMTKKETFLSDKLQHQSIVLTFPSQK